MRSNLAAWACAASLAVGASACTAQAIDDEEPSDDPAAVTAAELRAGGIDQIVVVLPESELASIVARVERLEARGAPAATVETYAVARALEAWRRAVPARGSTPAEPSSIPPTIDGAVRPLGGYLWDHLKLNPLEGALCRSKKVACIKTLHVAHLAKSRSRALYTDGENGGRRDAFRHSYWNARMVWAAGEAWAKAFADAHENGYPENRATPRARLLSEMDFFNNEVGRAYGGRIDADGALADALRTAIAEGELRAVRVDPSGAPGELVGTDTCTASAPCGV